MDLIKCPVCGEKYSSSYRRCPFCEEEDRPRKVSGKRRGGHHVAERKHTHSARGPLIAVLLVVLVVFSWYLFGGKFMEKIQEDRANDVRTYVPPRYARRPTSRRRRWGRTQSRRRPRSIPRR